MVKKFKISARTVLSVLTLALVVYVIKQNWPDIVETLNHFSEMNGFILLLLIPEQFIMYYALGKIFFSYLENRRGIKESSKKELLRISMELNFVNHAVPAGGFGGLAFLTYRLHRYDVTAGQSSFMYIFRYVITTVFNYVQALIAIIILAILNQIPAEATWIIWVSLIMNAGVFGALTLLIVIASSKKRLDFFSKIATNFVNFVVKIFSFGRKKNYLKPDKINHVLLDIHESVLTARKEKRQLKKPVFWGIAYSFFEIATYWIVAISIGHPELLPHIMVGEAIGSVFDGIVPYGLYELGMAGVMIALGVDFQSATIITVATRVFILILTIVSGWYPYNKTITEKNNERSA